MKYTAILIMKKIIKSGKINLYRGHIFNCLKKCEGDLNARVWHYATCRYLYHENVVQPHAHIVSLVSA